MLDCVIRSSVLLQQVWSQEIWWVSENRDQLWGSGALEWVEWWHRDHTLPIWGPACQDWQGLASIACHCSGDHQARHIYLITTHSCVVFAFLLSFVPVMYFGIISFLLTVFVVWNFALCGILLYCRKSLAVIFFQTFCIIMFFLCFVLLPAHCARNCRWSVSCMSVWGLCESAQSYLVLPCFLYHEVLPWILRCIIHSMVMLCTGHVSVAMLFRFRVYD